MTFEADLNQHYAGVSMRLRGAPPDPPPQLRRIAPPAPQPTVPQPSAPLPPVGPPSQARQRFRWRHIVDEVCSEHQVTFDEIKSGGREKGVVSARHEIMWRMRRETAMSLPEIGRRLGGFSHATVFAAVRKEEDRREALVKAGVATDAGAAVVNARLTTLKHENRLLRDENDVLRERQAALDMPEVIPKPLPANLPRLSCFEERVFRAMFRREGRLVFEEALHAVVYAAAENPESNSLKVIVSHLRKKLKGTGFVITTDWGRGWTLSRKKVAN